MTPFLPQQSAGLGEIFPMIASAGTGSPQVAGKGQARVRQRARAASTPHRLATGGAVH